MASNTYIGIDPNGLVRSTSGELTLFADGSPVAFFSSSANVVFSGSLGIEGVEDISASLAGMISSVTAGDGLSGGGLSGDVSVALNTGSLHFIEGVLKSGLFRLTGSAYSTTSDIQITGSLDVNLTESGQEFRVASQSVTQFKVNSDGIMVLTPQSSEPVFVSGGMYYSNSGSFFLGTAD